MSEKRFISGWPVIYTHWHAEIFLQVMLVICQVRCFVGCSKHAVTVYSAPVRLCCSCYISLALQSKSATVPSPCCRLVPAAHSQQTFLTLPKSYDEISLPDTIVFDYEAGYMIFGTVMCGKADYVSSASLDWCRFPLEHCPLLTAHVHIYSRQTWQSIYEEMFIKICID